MATDHTAHEDRRLVAVMPSVEAMADSDQPSS